MPSTLCIFKENLNYAKISIMQLKRKKDSSLNKVKKKLRMPITAEEKGSKPFNLKRSRERTKYKWKKQTSFQNFCASTNIAVLSFFLSWALILFLHDRTVRWFLLEIRLMLFWISFIKYSRKKVFKCISKALKSLLWLIMSDKKNV